MPCIKSTYPKKYPTILSNIVPSEIHYIEPIIPIVNDAILAFFEKHICIIYNNNNNNK